MKKVLFLTDKYFPKAYANAICIQPLIEKFQEKGWDVSVLCFKDSGIPTPKSWRNAKIFSIKPDLRLQLFYYSDNFRNTPRGKLAFVFAHALSKARKIFTFPWDPFYSFSFPKRIYKKVATITNEEPYDLIVSVLNPLDASLGLIKFKKKGGDIPWVIFSVDTLENARLSKSIFKKICDPFFWEKRLLTYCDCYLYMSSRSQRYNENRFLPWKEKLIESDLPRLSTAETETNHDKQFFNTNSENWVYAGSLGGKHYSAGQVISFFLGLPPSTTRTLHFFVRGNDIKKIKDEQIKSMGKIMLHEYVDYETLKLIQKQADILVSFKTSDQISSKIFDYFSYKKPVIHFSGNPADPNSRYVKKYPLGFVVELFKPWEGQKRQLLEFIKSCKSASITTKQLLEAFPMNDPDYSYNLITERFHL